MATLKEQLLNAPDLMRKTVKVAEGAATVMIRRFTVGERDELLALMKSVKEGDVTGNSALNAAVVVRGTIDSGLAESDIQGLPASVVTEIVDAIMEFNGWSARARAALGDQFRTSARSTV